MVIDPPAGPAPESPAEPEFHGLECRHCGCRHFLTIWTRHELGRVRRLRECRHCGARYHTEEQITGDARPKRDCPRAP